LADDSALLPVRSADQPIPAADERSRFRNQLRRGCRFLSFNLKWNIQLLTGFFPTHLRWLSPERNMKATKLPGLRPLPSAKPASIDQLASDYKSSNFSGGKSCLTAMLASRVTGGQRWKTCSQAGSTKRDSEWLDL
jgi:hypothetical protein